MYRAKYFLNKLTKTNKICSLIIMLVCFTTFRKLSIKFGQKHFVLCTFRSFKTLIFLLVCGKLNFMHEANQNRRLR